jgi:hypothetical protein
MSKGAEAKIQVAEVISGGRIATGPEYKKPAREEMVLSGDRGMVRNVFLVGSWVSKQAKASAGHRASWK